MKRNEKQTEQRAPKSESQPQDLQFMPKENFDGLSADARGVSPKSSNNQTPSPRTSKSEKKNEFKQQTQPEEIVRKLDFQNYLFKSKNLMYVFFLFSTADAKVNIDFVIARVEPIGATYIGNSNAHP